MASRFALAERSSAEAIDAMVALEDPVLPQSSMLRVNETSHSKRATVVQFAVDGSGTERRGFFRLTPRFWRSARAIDSDSTYRRHY